MIRLTLKYKRPRREVGIHHRWKRPSVCRNLLSLVIFLRLRLVLEGGEGSLFGRKMVEWYNLLDGRVKREGDQSFITPRSIVWLAHILNLQAISEGDLVEGVDLGFWDGGGSWEGGVEHIQQIRDHLAELHLNHQPQIIKWINIVPYSWIYSVLVGWIWSLGAPR